MCQLTLSFFETINEAGKSWWIMNASSLKCYALQSVFVLLI